MPRPRFLKLDPDRRNAIVSAAKAEFAESGFEQASYNRIIERAGLSKGAMYYYFDDKLDLYVTVLEAVNDEFVAFMEMGENWQPTGDFWLAMGALGAKSFEFATAHPELLALMKSIQSFPMKARKEGRLGELFDVWRGMLLKLLEHGQAREQVRVDVPVALLVEICVALDEAIDFWLFDNIDQLQPPANDNLIETVLDFYKRMLAP